MIVLFLPLAWVLARQRTAMSVETSIALLTIITVPVTFFGWSYDQSILLIPAAQIFSWLPRLSSNALRIGVMATILLSVSINWIQRLINTNEVYYLWIPLLWAVVYGVCVAAKGTAVSTEPAVEFAQ